MIVFGGPVGRSVGRGVCNKDLCDCFNCVMTS